MEVSIPIQKVAGKKFLADRARRPKFQTMHTVNTLAGRHIASDHKEIRMVRRIIREIPVSPVILVLILLAILMIVIVRDRAVGKAIVN